MEELSEARIRLRAYEIWKEQGCPFGMEEAHWQQAQIELAALDAYGLEPARVQELQAHRPKAGAKGRAKRAGRADLRSAD